MLTKKEYSNTKTWSAKFPDKKVSLSYLIDDLHESWHDLFNKLKLDDRFESVVEKELSDEMENNKYIIMHPQTDYLLHAFKLTKYKKLKVIFIGQDPYFDKEFEKTQYVSQAMGLSFSVPVGFNIPSSLKNIFSNLLHYNHIEKLPEHGNLESWAKQGCLMLNTSLTVKDGSANKNCHQYIWSWFTDEIISYISENKKRVIFVLWGANALQKISLIDEKKHHIIISSHPSGLSANKPMKQYPPFSSNDHFGMINEKLAEWNKDPIDWNIK